MNYAWCARIVPGRALGDARFDSPYSRVRDAADRKEAIKALNDAEVLVALGGASKQNDAYLANVLTTEALNRHRRLVALFAAVAYGSSAFIFPRLVLQFVFASPHTDPSEALRVLLTVVLLLASGTIALLAYLRAKHIASQEGY